MRKLILAAAVIATASGCALAPDAYRLEYLHASHLSAGPPFGDRSQEDSLDTLQVIGRYEFSERGYAEVGCGLKLKDGGFYGPKDVCTVRTGFEFRP